MKILISAGESSGDRYAAALAAELSRRHPELALFGCAGPLMRESGVRAVVRAESLGVVGLVEVVAHIPRIYGEYRRLIAEAAREKPDLAILTDSPDFHLRVARRCARLGIPVVYLVAPQAWAWREGRVKQLRRNVRKLLCIFPFEEKFFRDRGVDASFIGHPLARRVAAGTSREEFFARHRFPLDRPLVALMPGSRTGEVARHIPVVAGAVRRMREAAVTFAVGIPPSAPPSVYEPLLAAGVSPVRAMAWDLMAHADVVLAASGTVTMEAALLGTPMVTFYQVSGFSWMMGRWLVKAPFLTMVNLVAERRVVPELIQDAATPETLAAEVMGLLSSPSRRARMKEDLRMVAARLATGHDPIERAAGIVDALMDANPQQ